MAGGAGQVNRMAGKILFKKGRNNFTLQQNLTRPNLRGQRNTHKRPYRQLTLKWPTSETSDKPADKHRQFANPVQQLQQCAVAASPAGTASD